MTSPFQSAITGALATLRAATGEAITYTRAGDDPITITDATKTQPESKTVDVEELLINFKLSDFLITAAHLAALDPPEPRPDDHITVTATGKSYIVVETDELPPFEYSDSFETEFRVHTRKKSA